LMPSHIKGFIQPDKVQYGDRKIHRSVLWPTILKNRSW
jgi:hypothetical protein